MFLVYEKLNFHRDARFEGMSFEASGRTQCFKGNMRCYWEGRLKGYTDHRRVSRQEELLSDIGPVVLARRMDKGSNRCTEAREASAGVLGGSTMVPGGSGAVQERREMLWDMCRSLARHKWCNQCRMSREKLRGRRSSRFWRAVQRRAWWRLNESLSWLVVIPRTWIIFILLQNKNFWYSI